MDYRPRLIDARLERALAVFSAVSLVGPRASGKTTSASRRAASVARLDEPAAAALFNADVDRALAGRAKPALLDEWQEIPSVLGAVKRAVDHDRAPGQFLLTGSVSAEMDNATWPGTGRVIRLTMGTMTQREQRGLVDTRPTMRELLCGEVSMPPNPPDLIHYVELAQRGGFPEATMLTDHRDIRMWHDSYVEQLVNRDAMRIADGRDAARLRRYLQTWGLNSAGIVDDTTIYASAGIDRRTHLAYEQLLRNLFVAEIVPAWTSNRLKRLVLAPKRYLCDTGLMCAASRIGRLDILEDGNLLGRVIDTLVFNELRLHAAADDEPCSLHHLRTAGGRQEVDLVIEFDGGRVFGIEIKATAAPTAKDARHLRWMRAELASAFVGGVVFHTGPEIVRFDDNIVALPIAALWGARA